MRWYREAHIDATYRVSLYYSGGTPSLFGKKTNKQTNKNSSLFPFLFGFGFGLPRWHSVQALGCVQLIVTPWTAVRQASLSITNSQSLLKLMSTQSVMPSSYVILCHPFSSRRQSFPASGSFPMNQFFTSGDQSIGVSASISVLPMNNQDLFPLGLTGLILQAKGVSRVFSNTTVQKHQFFSAQLSLWSNSHIHTWLLEKPGGANGKKSAYQCTRHRGCKRNRSDPSGRKIPWRRKWQPTPVFLPGEPHGQRSMGYSPWAA